MIDDQDNCMARIEPILTVLHDCLLGGMAFYQDPENYSPAAVAQQRERTVADCVNDHAFHKLRESLEGKPGCHFLSIRGLEVLNYQDDALIRIKKVNGAGRGRNAITKQQMDYDAQLPLPGLPSEASRLVAGMLIGMLDKCLSVCYPLKHGYNLPNEPSQIPASLS